MTSPSNSVSSNSASIPFPKELSGAGLLSLKNRRQKTRIYETATAIFQQNEAIGYREFCRKIAEKGVAAPALRTFYNWKRFYGNHGNIRLEIRNPKVSIRKKITKATNARRQIKILPDKIAAFTASLKNDEPNTRMFINRKIAALIRLRRRESNLDYHSLDAYGVRKEYLELFASCQNEAQELEDLLGFKSTAIHYRRLQELPIQ